MANFDPIEYMGEVWAASGPFAFNSFLERGRGAVVIVPTASTGGNGGQELIFNNPVQYLTVDAKNVPEDIAETLRRYDPRREIVFIFKIGEKVSHYRFSPDDQLSPKDLYKRQLTDLTNEILPEPMIRTYMDLGDMWSMKARVSYNTEPLQVGDKLLYKDRIYSIKRVERNSPIPRDAIIDFACLEVG